MSSLSFNHNSDVSAGEIPHRNLEVLAENAHTRETIIMQGFGRFSVAYSIGHRDAREVQSSTAPVRTSPSAEVVATEAARELERSTGLSGAELERNARENAEREGDQPIDVAVQTAQNSEMAASARVEIDQVFNNGAQSDYVEAA